MVLQQNAIRQFLLSQEVRNRNLLQIVQKFAFNEISTVDDCFLSEAKNKITSSVFPPYFSLLLWLDFQLIYQRLHCHRHLHFQFLNHCLFSTYQQSTISTINSSNNTGSAATTESSKGVNSTRQIIWKCFIIHYFQPTNLITSLISLLQHRTKPRFKATGMISIF